MKLYYNSVSLLISRSSIKFDIPQHAR